MSVFAYHSSRPLSDPGKFIHFNIMRIYQSNLCFSIITKETGSLQCWWRMLAMLSVTDTICCVYTSGNESLECQKSNMLNFLFVWCRKDYSRWHGPAWNSSLQHQWWFSTSKEGMFLEHKTTSSTYFCQSTVPFLFKNIEWVRYAGWYRLAEGLVSTTMDINQ